MRRLVLLAGILFAPGCLVLSLNPVYEPEALGWDAALIGSWESADDHSSVAIERGEWNSYRIKYANRIESGILTGYLTSIGDDVFLDVMPARGQDRGSFLVPVHLILRVRLDGDRLELTPLSYDWFAERAHAVPRPAGLDAVPDQKENAVIVSSTAAIRAWLRNQPADAVVYGDPAIFTRKRAH